MWTPAALSNSPRDSFMDSTFLQTMADLFINLSAGWFGIAFIAPKSQPVRIRLLTVNIVYGIVCLVIAFMLREVSL